jgi:hypothetical protein
MSNQRNLPDGTTAQQPARHYNESASQILRNLAEQAARAARAVEQAHVGERQAAALGCEASRAAGIIQECKKYVNFNQDT